MKMVVGRLAVGSWLAACCATGTAAVAAGTEELVKNAAFEEISDAAAANWQESGRRKSFVVARGVGHNGSGGVVWQSEKPSASQVALRQEIKLETGVAYAFSALVRTENFSCKRGGACVCVEWSDAQGKWMGGGYARALNDRDADWTVIEGATKEIPTNAVTMHVQVYVAKGAKGKVSFDNLIM